MQRHRLAATTLSAMVLFFGAFAASSCSIGAAQPTQYTNPVFTPDLADPSIIKADDGFFYAYGTENNWQDGKSAHMIPIVRSKNLVNWEYVADAFERRPTWKSDGGGLWAPDISLHNGTYYLYYAWSLWGDTNPGIGVATAEKPGGPFTDHGPIIRSKDIGVENSIDPMYFRDEDGKQYLIWGSFRGIYGIELSDDGLKTAGEKFKMAGNQFEAPYLIKRNGGYFLFLSSGACCEGENSSYFAVVGRADTIRGPFVNQIGGDLISAPGNPVVWGYDQQPKSGTRFVGPGHNSIIQDSSGTDWLIYHAVDVANPRLGQATRRPLMIDPLVWTDGWPAVKDLLPSNSPQTGPLINK